MKINVIFYSLYGHNYKMAQAVAEGAREVEGAEVGLFQVQETFTPEVLEKMRATESKKSFEHIPVATVDNLTEADALIFGTPTRFGMMAAQMRAFLDRTGGIWVKGTLIGKVGSVFTSSSTQHGGQEATILSFHTTLLHHGMIIVGVPYSEERQSTLDEITGGSPYGASTITGSGPGTRQPSENELWIARFQGRHVAEITKKLVGE
ncbi:NAD(P)H:quinone oxidoreductase type IV [Methanolobus sediminis]|uniref:NAD(P)H dehydrogenase (quinone) n=1 Tax=Methanolobus sediminis TaxID=3072978 RepID=A0AA51YKK2_9EURY|nr:NAD(P)H:quinone oxidoreductase type IV [Methanolobus sediminis]WMW23997.1 NAD(P)H:quinone oxidoreductase type IV [Methanolobus sediminis]